MGGLGWFQFAGKADSLFVLALSETGLTDKVSYTSEHLLRNIMRVVGNGQFEDYFRADT